MNLTDITPHWIALHEDLGLGAPIADEAQYERLLALVDELFDSTAADPAHQLGGLVALLAERIGEYERRVHPWPPEFDANRRKSLIRIGWPCELPLQQADLSVGRRLLQLQ